MACRADSFPLCKPFLLCDIFRVDCRGVVYAVVRVGEPPVGETAAADDDRFVVSIGGQRFRENIPASRLTRFYKNKNHVGRD